MVERAWHVAQMVKYLLYVREGLVTFLSTEGQHRPVILRGDHDQKFSHPLLHSLRLAWGI